MYTYKHTNYTDALTINNLIEYHTHKVCSFLFQNLKLKKKNSVPKSESLQLMLCVLIQLINSI